MAGEEELGLLKGVLKDLTSKETISAIVIWQVLSSLISDALTPLHTELTKRVEALFPDVPMSPPDLADATVRGFMEPAEATSIARQSGVDAEDFAILVNLAGDAPAPGQLAEALRRAIIPYNSGSPEKPGFTQGIAQGRLANKWTDMIARISQAYPSPTDIVDATVKGQITYEEGHVLYQMMGGALSNHDDIKNLPFEATDKLLGVNKDIFGLLYNAAGSSPTPLELASMYHRGIIKKSGYGPDVLSFDQGVAESHYKNKWAEAYFKLSTPVPTAQQISTLLASGSITVAEATQQLKELGLPQLIIESYLKHGSSTKTTATKELAESTVLALYVDKLIDRSTAISMLESLKYTSAEADFIMSVQDLKRVQQALNQAVSRLHTLYTGHKIDRTAAINALNNLRIPATEVSELLQNWDLERANNVKVLTQAEVTDAYKDGFIDQGTAQSLLQEIGYQPHDAWLLLSLKMKTKQPNEPPLTSVNSVTPI